MKKTIGKKSVQSGMPGILLVTKPFNAVQFMGKDYVEEPDFDRRSLLVTKINPATIVLETCLKKGEKRITIEDKLARLRAQPNFVPYGAKQLIALLDDYKAKQENSLLEWLYRTKNARRLEFFGTPVRDLDPEEGSRAFLTLFRMWDGDWDWEYGCGYCSTGNFAIGCTNDSEG